MTGSQNQRANERNEMPDKTVGAFQATYAELYDRHLVPLLFAPYARILAQRAKDLAPSSILEIAAGTGVVTRQLAQLLPPTVRIIATDVNQPMIDQATHKRWARNVTWQQADAIQLPFPDQIFDLVVCQFGAMFFPDKLASFREVARVLRPQSVYLLVVWGDWNEMERAPLAIAARVVGNILQCDPGLLVNPPYHDEVDIRRDLKAATFGRVEVELMEQPAVAASAREAAFATVSASLIRTVVERMQPERLHESIDAVERAFIAQFGTGVINGATNALVITATKSLD